MAKPLQLWVITDGRAGHVSMLLGFCRRLAARLPVETHWLDINEQRFRYRGRQRLLEQFATAEKPDWVLATGSHCFWPLIWTRVVMGARSIALQNPAQPLHCFDAVVVPEHDGPRQWRHVFVSQGVLNKIEPVTEGRDPRRGLVLLGGINKHYAWDDDYILRQVAAIATAQPEVSWTVSDSPRTPAGMLAKVAALGLGNIVTTPFAECATDWLQEQLAAVGQAWVSRDSVSMVYEGLSAAAPTGLLHLEKLRDSRVTRCMDKLLVGGQASDYRQANLRQVLPTVAPLNETQRAVDWFIDFAGLADRRQEQGS